jgi:phage FluMu protein Com
MKELKCPKCKTIIDVKHNTGNIHCPKCIDQNGEVVIMLESSTTPSYIHLGDGFFQETKK